MVVPRSARVVPEGLAVPAQAASVAPAALAAMAASSAISMEETIIQPVPVVPEAVAAMPMVQGVPAAVGAAPMGRGVRVARVGPARAAAQARSPSPPAAT